MEEALENTTPFLTLDAMVSDRLAGASSVILSGDWKSFVDGDDDLRIRLVEQGVKNPDNRNEIPWDDANLFFISCVDTNAQGRTSQLEAGISNERFGRFPHGDGSVMTYLADWIRPAAKNAQQFPELIELFEKLDHCMVGSTLENGVGGLQMRGWLDISEVKRLRQCLTSRCWTPAADEPLDGGCQDAAKHLVAMLRAAEKRRCGVVLRVHT